MKTGYIDVLLGLQWGDEGKGKIVDYFSPDYDIVARFNGGPNAGHTIQFGGTKLVTHSVPSGILGKGMNLIGAGVVIDPVLFYQEISEIKSIQPQWQRLIILSEEATLILPILKHVDAHWDKIIGIGTTKKGIGPAYADLAQRCAFMVRDIVKPNFKERIEKLTNYYSKTLRIEEKVDNSVFFEMCDWMVKNLETVPCSIFVNSELKAGKNILAEGAQGSLLDNRFGTYPYVTSSPCTTGGVLTGLGVGANVIRNVYGVFKAYCTRVGSGPMPGELNNKIGEKIQELGNEVGATTGRKRRPAWLDLVALKYACDLNGVTHPIMTKGDIFDDKFFKTISLITSYGLSKGSSSTDEFISDSYWLEQVTADTTSFKAWDNLSKVCFASELSDEFNIYKEFIEKEIGYKIAYVSNGIEREKMIQLF